MEAREKGELSFPKGARIRVRRKDPSGWWEGGYTGKTGVFPGSYVKE